MSRIQTVGIAGAGLIGAGWAARALARGLDVVAYDPVAATEKRFRSSVDNAWPSMLKLMDREQVERGTLSFTPDVEDMAQQADWIQEAAPEREDLKIALLAKIDAVADSGVVVASSSSGFLPTRLQAACSHPERLLIGHPFNPVYLLPLVEIVPGEQTSDHTMQRAAAFYESIGMYVLRLKREIDGYLCDRLQEALWREALHLIHKDVATTSEIDDSLVFSAGLRYAFMGPFLTYHLAGGEGGMRHFLDHFDPTEELPWTDLRFPEWSDEMSRRLIDGCEEQAEGRSVEQWEAKRDEVLVDLMKVLEKHGIGAGTLMSRERARCR
ncbi:MAG TPA: 3-hydroxyacyl-CoA dehydrogenase NAD-binding domain-containing protein [Acidobacteriota bacterium]|nr:3-hydroxyacyl-CoA dehydrogenase NAD-binding domain-containing protein [Acidobacteriota bacterium]